MNRLRHRNFENQQTETKHLNNIRKKTFLKLKNIFSELEILKNQKREK